MTNKTHIAMLCPCCGAEVIHRRYGFDVIVVAPLRMITWYVCDDCEAALTGNDDAARDKATQAFVDYFESSSHAPRAHAIR